MDPERFAEAIEDAGFYPIMGIPCSVFTPFLNYINDNKEIEKYICTSEGEAMGLAAGFALSGKIPVVYIQNDGYGNAVNPLSSLQLLYKLPALMLISWRAKPGEIDAPQHQIMGRTILKLLDVFEIPYAILEDGIDSLRDAIKKAKTHIKNKSIPFAFIVKKGYFQRYESKILPVTDFTDLNMRLEYIKLLAKNIKSDDILLGATGFSGRELYQIVGHKGKFYMMGSMGCLTSIGLGIAIEHNDRNIFVLDGDGALLMKMGTFATIGHYEPGNFIHICFDNNQYESTGGQPTLSQTTDFIAIAKACGYKSTSNVTKVEEFQRVLKNIKKYKNPHFICISVKSGTIEGIKRPSDSPEEMRKKIMEFLKK